jgi:hypothetical protein
MHATNRNNKLSSRIYKSYYKDLLGPNSKGLYTLYRQYYSKEPKR